MVSPFRSKWIKPNQVNASSFIIQVQVIAWRMLLMSYTLSQQELIVITNKTEMKLNLVKISCIWIPFIHLFYSFIRLFSCESLWIERNNNSNNNNVHSFHKQMEMLSRTRIIRMLFECARCNKNMRRFNSLEKKRFVNDFQMGHQWSIFRSWNNQKKNKTRQKETY